MSKFTYYGIITSTIAFKRGEAWNLIKIFHSSMKKY